MEGEKEIISLNIETSTTLCSVSLGRGDICADCIEVDEGVFHAEKLHVFIADALKKNSIDIRDVSVVSVSSGPGSYTGLRIGAASAKTIAFALNVPLITISSLQVQALGYLELYKNNEKNIVSTMYAREKKIYLAAYTSDGKETQPPTGIQITDEGIEKIKEQYADAVYIGSGAKLLGENTFEDKIKPSSRYMIKEVVRRFKRREFTNLVYFEPMYI